MAGTGVGKFSSTAGNNTSNMTTNFAENMAPSNVNNAARELMGHIYDMYKQLGDGYFEFGDGDATYTVARSDADTITITSSSDISSIYFPGRKIRITDGGANVVEGTIASSSHTSTTQTVNLTGISLASGTPTKVELGIDTAAFGGRLILDDDGDTYIEAPTDDTIDIYIGGAKDFVFTANTLTAESGSSFIGTLGVAGTATSVAGIPFYNGDTSSIYTHDVSATDNSAEANSAYGLLALDATTTADNNVAVGYQAGTDINTGGSNTILGALCFRNATSAAENVVIGYLAGGAGTATSGLNVVIGNEAAEEMTSMSEATVVGYKAATSNTTGSHILAMGYQAYDGADTENHNLAIGSNALGGSVAGGEYNVAVGNYTLDALTSADKNTVIGYNAGTAITTGGNNTLVGFEAGRDITDDTGNVLLGHRAASNLTDSNNVVIGTDAARVATSFSNTVVIGASAVGSGVMTGDNNIIIGKTAGEVLTSAASNILIGIDAGKALTTGGDNIFMGQSSGDGHDAETNNIGIGKASMGGSINGGEYNVAIGNFTLDALTSANSNVAVGYAAGSAITTSPRNTIIGESAGVSLATGDGRNVIIGTGAGDAAVVASSNVFIGDEAVGGGVATGSHNIAIGRNSGHDLTSASEGCFVGFESGKDVTTSNYNTLIGMKAGDSISTGDGRNTAVGLRNFTQGTALTTGNNNIALGERCKVTASNANFQFIIGSNVTSNGNSTTTIGYDTTEIATNHGSASWAAVSDERYKKDIEDSSAGLSFINDLRPVTFKFKQKNELDTDLYGYDANSTDTDGYTDEVAHGFLAQEIKTAIDNHSEIKAGQEIWKESPEAKGKRQNVSHIGMIPMLVKAVQELSAQVTTLQQELKTIKGE